MSVFKFVVKRPVAVKMFTAGAVILGVIALLRLPCELFPAVEYPQITIACTYKGAAPVEIESLVTKPIEESVGTVGGVKNIRSVSREGVAIVMLDFNWGTNMDMASMAVREKIDLIKERLPLGANEPIVVKYNPFQLPVIALNVTGRYSAPQLYELANDTIKNEMEKVDGVASCVISGGQVREVKIDIDQARLRLNGLSILDVVDAVKKSNLNYPVGTIEESFYEQLIRTVGEFDSLDQVKNVPVYISEEVFKNINEPYKKSAIDDGEENAPTLEGEREAKLFSRPTRKFILLRDIANISEGTKEKTTLARYNGQDTVSISVQKRADSNTVQVANGVKKRLKQLKSVLPKNTQIYITYDQSLFINDAVQGVSDAAVQGGFLAFLVLLFFLRSLRSALIVVIAIPISVVITFAGMYFHGVTLNIISLGGLALGIGILTDNSIVVVENIMRLRKEGMSADAAIEKGTQEVAGAIVSSNLTTIIVFLPMVFISGIAGQIFGDLAFTVIVSSLVSMVVSLTLIPSICRNIGEDMSYKAKEVVVLQEYFAGLLEKALGLRAMLFKRITILFFIAMAVFMVLGRELMPAVDQGQFVVKLKLPPGTSLKVTDDVARVSEEYLLNNVSVASVVVNIGAQSEKKAADVLQALGASEAQLMVNLKPIRPFWVLVDLFGHYRHQGSRKVVQGLKKYLKSADLHGAQVEYILQESVFAATDTASPVVVEIKGYDLKYLESIAMQVREKMLKMRGVYGVRDSIALPSPEERVVIDKDKAAVLGFSVSDIATAMQAAVEGKVASKFKEGGKEVDIRVRLRPEDRKSTLDLNSLVIHSPSGADIALADVASIVSGRGPTEITHENKERVVKVWCNLYKRSVNSAVSDIKHKILPKLKLKKGYAASIGGEAQAMRDSFLGLIFAVLLSLLLIYMVMAAQFEDLRQPFIVMFTVPLALIGVAFTLFFTFTKLSLIVFLGIIILGGVAVNNGIVLIDCVNRLRKEEGLSAREAALQGSRMRFRPIMMTAATSVLGLLPMGFAVSPGAKLQQPMAVTIMAGMLVSTFLSLVVIPVIYVYLEERGLKS